MANIIPYINFLHKSNEAVTFYKAIFGGDAEVQMDGDHVIQMEFQAGDITLWAVTLKVISPVWS